MTAESGHLMCANMLNFTYLNSFQNINACGCVFGKSIKLKYTSPLSQRRTSSKCTFKAIIIKNDQSPSMYFVLFVLNV